MISARMDGGCIKNPGGPGSCACVIYNNGREVYRASRLLEPSPRMTNNVAEFEGMKLILEWLQRHPDASEVRIFGDSEIVINRMSGKSKKPPMGVCKVVAYECLAILQNIKRQRVVIFKWERRVRNEDCDKMCSEKLRQYMKSSRVPSYMSDNKGFKYGAEVI